MEEEEIRKILQIILENLKGREFIWRIEGSVNLWIQGIKTSVLDLDITTNDKGIKIFRRVLKKYIIKDFFSQKIKGSSLICNFNGFEVEINSYGDRESNMFDKTKKISWGSMFVPILPMKYAKKFYEFRNDKEKVNLISKYLLRTNREKFSSKRLKRRLKEIENGISKAKNKAIK